MRMTSHILAGTLVCLLTAVPLVGQAIQIAPGQEVRGELESGDQVSGDGSYHDVYLLQGRAGDRLEISMSADFDTYLWIGRSAGSGFDALDTDDDGGPGTDSRLEVTLPADGIYQILANSLSVGATGSYTLRVSAAGSTSATPIRAGETRLGRLEGSDPRLSDDSHYDLYAFQGRAGQTLEVELSSDDFDAYLVIGRDGGGGFSEIESDDDGGDGTNSRLVVTLDRDGEYLIRANSLSGGSTGSYALRVATRGGSGGGAAEIRAGETRTGRLESGDATMDDDSFYDSFRYQGRAGEDLVITLESEDFDAYLSIGILHDGTFEYMESDDDGGSGTDSRLEITLPRTGTYEIRANSLYGGSRGEYVLGLRSY
jgi:hypothetical protein